MLTKFIFRHLVQPTKGTLKWWDVIVQQIPSTNGSQKSPQLLSISRDITEQKKHELEVNELLTRFQNLVAQAPVAICVLRGKNYVIEVINEGMLEMWDRKNEDAINRPAFDVLPELRDQGFKELLDNVYNNGERFVADELPINLMRNGKIENAFVKFIYEPLRETDGTISGVMALAHEITGQVTARKRIEESENRYHNMIYSSPVAIGILKGQDFIITIANDAIIEIFGKGKDIIGRQYFDIMPELVEQGYREVYNEVYTTGKPFVAIETPVNISHSGKMELRYYNLILQPQRNVKNQIEGIGIIASEVTTQARFNIKIKESEAHFKLLTDLMPEKISNTDPQGNVIYYNKKWMDYTGLTFEELKGRGWDKTIHPDDIEETSNRWKLSFETGNDFEIELRILNKNGEYKWHLSRAKAVKAESGEIKMWIGVNTDIQKIKDEVNRKQDFLSMVSHEVKTPLTSIKAYVQLLLTLITEKQEALLAPFPLKTSLVRIDKLISRMNRLVIDMLDLSRIEASRLELQINLFDLNKLVNQVVEDILYTNPDQAISISHEFDCSVSGDKDRIEQVIINIVNNAMKYSENGEGIEIRIYKAPNKQVSVSVKDNGIGIAKKDQEKIFERFYRVDGKNEYTFPGFGIGLFIANEIIKRHNGFITIESVKGKGSTFTFTIPLMLMEAKEFK